MYIFGWNEKSKKRFSDVSHGRVVMHIYMIGASMLSCILFSSSAFQFQKSEWKINSLFESNKLRLPCEEFFSLSSRVIKFYSNIWFCLDFSNVWFHIIFHQNIKRYLWNSTPARLLIISRKISVEKKQRWDFSCGNWKDRESEIRDFLKFIHLNIFPNLISRY